MGRPRVFLDSSVLITALLSSKGASYALLQRGRKSFRFIINEYVLAEVQDVLRRKFERRPRLHGDLFLLLGLADIETLPSPPPALLEEFRGVIEPEDAPILASAVETCEYLATLDHDFLDEDVQRVARKHGLVICEPSDLLSRMS